MDGAPIFNLVERTLPGTRILGFYPELLSNDHPMACVTGTSSALAIRTDTMKEIILTEKDPTIGQTAYGLLSDLLTIVKDY